MAKKKSTVNIAKIAIIASVAVLSVAAAIYALTFSGRQRNSKAAAAPGACDVTFNVATPTPTLAPSITPTPGSCNICNYQVDAFWGPLIPNFVGGQFYSWPTNRLLSNFHDKDSSHPACIGLVPQQPVKVTISKLPVGCDRPIERGYLVAYFNSYNPTVPPGYVTATIINRSAKCAYSVGVASYKAAWQVHTKTPPTAEEYKTENLYDAHETTIRPRQTIKLNVKIPSNNSSDSCYVQPK